MGGRKVLLYLDLLYIGFTLSAPGTSSKQVLCLAWVFSSLLQSPLTVSLPVAPNCSLGDVFCDTTASPLSTPNFQNLQRRQILCWSSVFFPGGLLFQVSKQGRADSQCLTDLIWFMKNINCPRSLLSVSPEQSLCAYLCDGFSALFITFFN